MTGTEPTRSTEDTASETAERPQNVWTRWDTQGEGIPGHDGAVPVEDLHLHRYCDVGPFRSGDLEVLSEQSGVDPERRKSFYSWFIRPGLLRTGLRQTPLVVFAAVAVLLVGAAFAPGVEGVSVFLPGISPLVIVPLVGLVVVWVVLISLFRQVQLIDDEDLLRAVSVYGLLSLLLVGTATSVYLVVTSSDPTALPPNIVYVSGYLLTMFVCGLLVYDGMLRTEHLFFNLQRTLAVNPTVEDPPDYSKNAVETADETADVPAEVNEAYQEFLTSLTGRLGHRTSVGFGRTVPTGALFAVLLVAQFAALWLVGVGPQNLDFSLTLLVNVVLDVFVGVVAFQFLILVDAFHRLITDHYDRLTGETALEYRPFHPDGRGGFRDLGKFATRVNVILIVGGFYVVYRLFVQGLRVTPVQTVTNVPGDIGTIVWLVSYVGPLLLYVLAAGAWLYYSFWHLHLKMARQRELQYTTFQRRARSDGTKEGALGAVVDADEWSEIRNNAPVWPINNRQLMGLISGTLFPVLLTLAQIVT